MLSEFQLQKAEMTQRSAMSHRRSREIVLESIPGLIGNGGGSTVADKPERRAGAVMHNHTGLRVGLEDLDEPGEGVLLFLVVPDVPERNTPRRDRLLHLRRDDGRAAAAETACGCTQKTPGWSQYDAVVFATDDSRRHPRLKGQPRECTQASVHSPTQIAEFSIRLRWKRRGFWWPSSSMDSSFSHTGITYY